MAEIQGLGSAVVNVRPGSRRSYVYVKRWISGSVGWKGMLFPRGFNVRGHPCKLRFGVSKPQKRNEKGRALLAQSLTMNRDKSRNHL